MEAQPDYYKGRGAQINTPNPYLKRHIAHEFHEGIDEPQMPTAPATQYYEEHPKNIVSKNNSPDIPFTYSINPYQGCEHGCSYCYARNAHQYWGFSAGMDFESKIIVKPDAARLLEQTLLKKTWQPEAISLSGNTDCYQPAEKKYQITRQLLKVFARYAHPVGIITKNQLITRDLDILKDLAAMRLVHVFISLPTLNEPLRRCMEPRTATGIARLKTIEQLSNAGVPVGVMTAPIIPGLNSNETPEIIRQAANAGALKAGYTILRLNGNVQHVFKDWLLKNYPNRFNKVWHQVAGVHGGTVSDANWGRRMQGQGPIAQVIKQLFKQAVQKHMSSRSMPPYDLTLFRRGGNLSLF